MTITVYIGDIDDSVRIAAESHTADAQFIFKESTLVDGVYYTSLGDLETLNQMFRILNQADTIVYVIPEKWSSEDMKKWTEFYLSYFSDRVNNLPACDYSLKMLELADHRASNDPQLWIAGCSISHGDAIEADQRYGELLAKQLSLPVSYLTHSGSSIEWASDQIVRSDIRSGDTVVWGITNYTRFPYWQHSVQHVNVGYYEKNSKFNKIIPLDRLSDDNQKYRSITSIQRAVNYCNKIGAELYMGGVIVTADFAVALAQFSNYKQFSGYPGINAHELFIDFGTDNKHPGPLTNQWYAQQFMHMIQR